MIHQIILVGVLSLLFGYVIGYKNREKKFWKNPIQYNVNGYPTLFISPKDGKVEITILNKKFVEWKNND